MATATNPYPDVPSPAGAYDVTEWHGFDEIVAAWDKPLRCQTDQTVRPCHNPTTCGFMVHRF
jgi:hypothetical protein